MKFSDFEHIIWDWNGTLLDDTWLCLDIINGFLLKHLNKKLSLEEYRNVFDFPVRDYYKKVGFDFSVVSFEKLAIEFTKIYETRKYECSLQNNSQEALKYCSNSNIPQSILSAYSQNPLKEIVTHFKISNFFSNITGLDNHLAEGKFDLARDFVKNLKVTPEKMLLVGDTLHDLEVSRDIGFSCVLIPQGHQSRERLLRSGGYVADSVAELI